MPPNGDPPHEPEPLSGVIRAWAPWCGSCRSMAPLVASVSAGSGIDVIDLRVDEEPELVERYRVRSVPTLIGVRHGAEVGRLVGLQSVDAIEALFSATTAPGGPVATGLPRSFVALRSLAGVALVGSGLAFGAVSLIAVGMALIAWALVGLARS